MSYADKSTSELFEILFSGDYEDPHGELLEEGPSAALRVLHNREDAPELAEHFLSSLVPTQRERSIDILARHASRREVAIPYLNDPDPGVVESAVYALGSWHGHPVHPAMLVAKNHPSSDVRLAVARGLTGNLPEIPFVLMHLMSDADDEVRNWATFTLGQQPQHDSPGARAALRERFSDSFEDVRDEAIWGLALRRDPQGLQSLLSRFESDSWCNGDEMAASDILGLRNAGPEELRVGLRALLR